MNTNEENKTEDRESGIQTYDRKKKSHGNFLKIGCASCGFVAVVALCVLSSRYSWFGVKADDEGISYNNGSELSYSTTAPVEEQKVPTKANKHNEAQETTVATSTTTSATTQQKPPGPQWRQPKLQPPHQSLHGQKRSVAAQCT